MLAIGRRVDAFAYEPGARLALIVGNEARTALADISGRGGIPTD